ncbi:anaerobic ribonucleoside-triphosphate reductase [Gynuella sunshinyii]|uniref:Oxygen-sensitive ribonucleoside-triphosphate reductase n=1 Tax=Gynuella sunshinyii YC6258 TaxID=1445510 RepID=A0A0C5V9I5_9GAMM|nr:anaerobic ribonucleoside-triphosphate reductase [Gynuella sunshinyii]AJQ96030.1 oxygen-sensitive ribonucleoside-triphosphate reductase [Gynuella sunshinyii YC6258]
MTTFTTKQPDSCCSMSEMEVVKRDGSVVGFSQERIFSAINKAANACEEPNPAFAASVTAEVMTRLRGKSRIDIDTIQKTVENVLMTSGRPEIARCYIEYRHDRDVAREKRGRLYTEVLGLIEQSNADLLNENANKDAKVIPTQRDLLAGITAREFAKRHLLPLDVVAAHERGEIHYHDLDYAPFFPMFNCMLVDLENMLSHGFKMGNADIGPPKSIATAAAVTAQIIAQVASHIYGGTTINRIDEVLAPYVLVSYEKHLHTGRQWQIAQPEDYAMALTEKECHDAFQALEYEVNTLHTSNGQTPFVTFGFGLGESWPARMIQKAILKNRIDGLGVNCKTAIFPKLVFTIKEGLNRKPEDPNYDIKQLALACAARRMYPDILNYDQVVKVTGSFKAPMGCRSFLSAWRNEQGELVHEGRNNMGVVSLNLPRIAIEAHGDEQRFYQILDQRLAIARKALDTRIERLSQVKAKVAPILYMQGACGVRLQAEDSVVDLFKQGRASISLGYIGIHETIKALYSAEKTLFDEPALQRKAVAIVRYLSDTVKQWQQQTGYGFSLYSTPSENLCSRFAGLDTKQFGLIEGVTDKGYYTNSFHLDVAQAANPFDKFDFEQPYAPLASGGFISYAEYPSMLHNLEALEQVWDYSYDRLPYIGTNLPIDECYECGFQGEFNCTSKGFACPGCGNHNPDTVSVTRRVCGYLGSPDARPFNHGKQIEVQKRVKHL